MVKISKEHSRKLSFFCKEVLEYLHEPDDGTIANRLLKQHPELNDDYLKELANKGKYIKRLSELINIKPEEFVETAVNIQPRLNFDVSDFVTNALNASERNDKVINIFLFCENINEKEALETLNEFNKIGFNSKTVIVFRSQLLGLSDGLDLFLNDYVSYSARINKSENVLCINPSKLVFALGAGCSVDANIGNWEQLSNALSFELLTSDDNYGLTNYGSKEVNENVLKALSHNFDKNSLIDIAVRKKKETEDKTSTYFNYVHDILYMNYNESNFDYKTKTLVAISSCIKRIKMKKIITYNFDSTLEKNVNYGYHSNPNEIKSSKTCLLYDNGEVEVFHVHGYIPYDYDGSTIASDFILSDTDYYLNSFKSNGLTNSIQNSLYSENDVIFIGCSFNDSNIKQVLLSLDKKRKNRIYAIMKIPSFSELSKERKNKELAVSALKYKVLINNYLGYFGVKVIWIKEFDEIPNIIDAIDSSESDIKINVDDLTADI